MRCWRVDAGGFCALFVIAASNSRARALAWDYGHELGAEDYLDLNAGRYKALDHLITNTEQEGVLDWADFGHIYRSQGWRSESEDDVSCDTCGLYSMGCVAGEICEHCDRCHECGCAPDCSSPWSPP